MVKANVETNVKAPRARASDSLSTQDIDSLFHRLSNDEVIARFDSSLSMGLSAVEVGRRYDFFGWNELPVQPGKPAWVRFLLQFHEPLLYILLLAGAVKAALGSWTNAGVIWGVTVVNAVIGYLQEAKAEEAIASLAKTVMTEATVVRDAQTLKIGSKELVPGDIVLLTSGDKVPADLRLLQSRSLQVDESALTGESVPVGKTVQPMVANTPLAERVNMAYAGSFVTFGQGRGIVVATAKATEVGKISQSMQQRVNLTTPLTRKFAKFSRLLLYCVLTLATITFAVGLAQGEAWSDMFEAAVALAVSAIPEGLPAVVTITLAIGVDRMARRHTIIRKLPAVEALGSATVVCSDKTGTLTENQMTVQAIYAGQHSYAIKNQSLDKPLPTALHDCFVAGVLCNDAQLKFTESDLSEEISHDYAGHFTVVGDPTEGGLLISAAKAGLSQEKLSRVMPRLDAIPFESQYQYMVTLHAANPHTIYVKGSVEALLGRCREMMQADGTLVAIDRAVIEQAVEDMTQKALRVLAFAKKIAAPQQRAIGHEDVASGLIFLGLQGMIDPPRPEAVAAVATDNQQLTSLNLLQHTGKGMSGSARRWERQEQGDVIEETDLGRTT